MLRAKDAAVTRESKLALILSFVLILVVGVLVSDYFSQANTMDPDRLEAQSRQPLAQLPGAERSRIDEAIERVLSKESAPEATQQPQQQQQPDPVVIANGSNRTGSLLNELSNGFSNGLSNGFAKTIDDLRAPALASPLPNRPASGSSATRQLGQIQHAVYTVQEGDSLYQIAARNLGDGNRWAEIRQLNSSMIGPSGIINPGMKLLLPANARVTEPKTTPMTQRQITSPQVDAKAYTVVSGDTLGEISMKLLGTSRRVDEFVTLNGLDDANDIRVGMTLKVPNK